MTIVALFAEYNSRRQRHGFSCVSVGDGRVGEEAFVDEEIASGDKAVGRRERFDR